MTSVVIAAHNEAAVIGRCLDALLDGAHDGEFDITVVANGCTDSTVEAAHRPGVRVLDLPQAGKPGALNAGDEVAEGFPRVYLDADIVVSASGLRALSAVLTGSSVLAAVPRRELDLVGRPMLVRAFFAINSRLPVYRDGLFGRGVIGLSEAGRGRFERFPDLVADDLFLDSLFTAAEKVQVDQVTSRIATPTRTADLMRRLVRVRQGNSAMRAAGAAGEVAAQVRPASRWSWLREVVLPRPWLAPAAACYVALTFAAAYRARRSPSGTQSWGRDESSRQPETQR